MPPLTGILGAIAGNCFTFSLALLWWSLLCRRKAFFDLAVLCFLWTYTTTLTVLVLGLSGTLTAGHGTAASLAGTASLLLLARRRLAGAAGDLLFLLRRAVATARKRPLTSLFLAAAFGLIALRMAVHVWYLGPYVYDTLTYHLPKVADWIRHGRLVALDTPVARSYWPANYELLAAWFALFFHHDFMTEAAGLPYYLLGIAGVAQAARCLGLGRRAALFAGLAYALTPSVLQNAVSCKNDIAVAGLFLFAAALVMRAGEGGPPAAKTAALVVMASGLAMGTKPYYAFLLPGMLLMAAGGRKALPGRLRRGEGADCALAVWAPSLLTALPLGLFWYARNFFLFRNPLYPVPFRLFAGFSGYEEVVGMQQGGFSLDSLRQTLSNLIFDRILDGNAPFNPELGGMSGWGWFAFACGVPAFVWALLFWKRGRWFVAGSLLAFLNLYCWVSPDLWNMRFALWFPSLFAVCFMGLLAWVPFVAVRWSMAVVAALCLAMNFVGTVGTGLFDYEYWHARVRTPLWERRPWAGQEVVLEVVLPGEVMAYNVHGNHWVYPLYGPDFSRGLRYLDDGEGEGYAALLRREGLGCIFFPGAEATGALSEDLDTGALVDRGGSLYCLGGHESR